MTHTGTIPAARAQGPDLTFGPGRAQLLSHPLAEAVLWEVWKASPERFGTYVKKAMIRLWGPDGLAIPDTESNGHGHA